MRTTLFILLFAGLAAAKENIPEKEPGPRTRGKVYQWKAKDGLVYRYYVPKEYSPDKGANLTFILHGSNLSAGWGFWNHKAGQFRPDDVVVSPDGTTPNPRGGFNFLGEPKDVKRLKALHLELKKIFKVNATYLYGHSQGSFFALHYLGEEPELVQGVVAHASGVWNWTQTPRKAHGVAIVFMHGTQDPVVPYGQSVGGYRHYREQKFPLVRLRSLEGWNHWPAEHNGPIPHTSQQLAWVEGMTTSDPERLKAAFEFLSNCKKKERHDYAAVYTLSKRVVELPFAPAAVRKRAEKAIPAVEALAEAHAKALGKVDKLGKTPPKGGWVVHLQVFLRAFMDVPAREELYAKWEPVLEKHEKDGLAQLKRYWNTKKPADGFKAGVAALQKGYLYFRCYDAEFLKKLAEWRSQHKQLKLSKKAVKDYDAIAPLLEKATKQGYKDFDSLNRKVAKW